jgi:hypothetical protein
MTLDAATFTRENIGGDEVELTVTDYNINNTT